jgi:histone-lysine N-methyltransferase ASH1L
MAEIMAKLSTIPSYFGAAVDKTPVEKSTSPTLQLPTPIPSCPSDTSSCVDNVPATEESSEKPRATRRVTRASLKAGTEHEEQQSKDKDVGGINNHEESSELPLGVEDVETSRSAQPEESVDTPTQDPASEHPTQTSNIEPRVTRRSSRFEASKDAQSNSETPSRQNASKEKSKEINGGKEPEKDKQGEEATKRRRSTRLTLLDKAGGIVENATTVLGKRSRDAMEKGRGKVKDLGKRASLRPRNVTGEAALPPKPEAPEAKKRRVSESDAAIKKKAVEETAEPPKPPPKKKPKRWLSHGLYAGQERNFDPRLTEAKNRVKNSKTKTVAAPQRKLLPLPMFAGERLLEQGRDFKLPFDIFSPSPAGQPKPDEWRKTNKSEIYSFRHVRDYMLIMMLDVFVGDATSYWKATKRGEVSTCMCTPETGCDEDCHNRYMFYECDNNNCKLGADVCKNRSFEGLRQRTKAGGKYNIGVEVIKTEDRGYGIRSNRTFEPNQIIVEYTGEILTQEDAENRMRKVYNNSEVSVSMQLGDDLNHTNNEQCYYLMYFDQNMIIDATRGSMARFVNHSCEPNCKMEKWTVEGKPRMALFAGERGVMTGEELTYDYNFE